jgi:phospholipid/cholesterol/gamma-HCH transport system ATP-binding protein
VLETRVIEDAAPQKKSAGLGPDDPPVIVFEHVSLAFDEKVVLDDISFTLRAGHMKLVLGASGAGKSTVLRLILGLLRADAGSIIVNGHPVHAMREREMIAVRAELGMVFQEGALFDSLTVRENVGFKLFEGTDMPIADVDARVNEVLGFVGLAEYRDRMPSDLSGGQRRRVAIARALTARPHTLLYDEPTTGLDPITALTVDEEIVKLRDLEQVSSIMVTHQLRDAFFIATHRAEQADGVVRFSAMPPDQLGLTQFLVLKSGKVAFEGTAEELRGTKDEYLRAFLS